MTQHLAVTSKMSLIINIAVPLSLEIVAAIKNGADVNSTETADEIYKASFLAITKAIKALPFNVTPKTESTLVDIKDDDDSILPDRVLPDTQAWSGWGSKSTHVRDTSPIHWTSNNADPVFRCVTPSSTFDGYTPSGIRTYWCLYASSSKSNSYYIRSKPDVDHVKKSNSDMLIAEELGWYEDVFVATIKTAILKNKWMQSLRDQVCLEFRGRTLDDGRDLCSVSAYPFSREGIDIDRGNSMAIKRVEYLSLSFACTIARIQVPDSNSTASTNETSYE